MGVNMLSPQEKDAFVKYRRMGGTLNMPIMTFGEIRNGQYEVKIDLSDTGIINVTNDMIEKVNAGADKNIVRFVRNTNTLIYKSETLFPSPDKIDKKKLKLFFILGNPAIHSVEKGMFFFSDTNGNRHKFWGKLAKTCLLENFELENRVQEAKARRKAILTGNTNHRFVIGLTTFYSLPTPTGIEGNRFCDSEGVKRLFGNGGLLKTIQQEECTRIMRYPFAKDAVLIVTISGAFKYLRDKIGNDRVKHWPIRGKGSGWKKLCDILEGLRH